MINFTFLFIFVLFLLMIVLAIAVFIQGIMFISSFSTNKKEILDAIKNYDVDSYEVIVKKDIPYTKTALKLMRKLWKDKELKNSNKLLYYYVKRYKIILLEMLIFAVLLFLSTIVVQVAAKKV